MSTECLCQRLLPGLEEYVIRVYELHDVPRRSAAGDIDVDDGELAPQSDHGAGIIGVDVEELHVWVAALGHLSLATALIEADHLSEKTAQLTDEYSLAHASSACS